jgi:mannosyltransferase
MSLAALQGRIEGLTYGRSLAGVVAAGALLRLALLARQPLGYDEDFTAAVVTRPFGQMIDAVSRDSGPPLFYAVEWLVAHVSAAPWALRLVPALAGIALIPLVAALARRVAGDAAGLWAAGVAAFLPATVLVSLNARMYAPAGTLVVAALLLGCRALETPEWRSDVGRWLAYFLAAAAAVWTDYFAVPALLGVLAAFAWRQPPLRALVKATVATGAAFATLAGWLFVARAQLDHAGQGFWVPPLGPSSAAGTLAQLVAGPPVDSGVPGREPLIGLQAMAIVAAAAALMAAAIWARREGQHAVHRAVFMLVACSGVLLLVAASVWRPFFEARYAAVMWLPLFALVGVGLAAVPRRTATLALLAIAVPSLALGGAITHPQTDQLVHSVEARMTSNDFVVADPDHYVALLAEGDPLLVSRLHVVAAESPPWYFGTAAYPAGAVVPSIPNSVAAAHGRIYFVADPDARPPSLPAAYVQMERTCVIGGCLTIFESSPAATPGG